MSLEAAEALPERHAAQLLDGYIKRKQFEAKILFSVLGEALKPKEEKATLAGLAMMGFGIKGLK